MANEICYLSAVSTLNAIKQNKLTCVDVMQSYLDRIKAVNPSLNAIVQQVNMAVLLEQAAQSDKRIAQGEKMGKLHGIPMTIKDHIKVENMIVTRGSVGLKNNRCTENASLVEKLQAEGAIIIGITNMPELGPAFETDNTLYGQTNNPYDVSKTSGGSSGGEAAIIASGGSAAGIGSDGGGSIRVPSHFCGIAGHKPTQHLVSCTGNVPGDGGMGMMFYTPGPMARYVEDLQLLLPIISGWDNSDPHLPLTPPALINKPIHDVRVGYIIENALGQADDDTLNVIEQVIQLLEKDAHSVKQVDFINIADVGHFLWEFYFCGGDQGLSFEQLLEKIGTADASPTLRRFLEAAKHSPLLNANQMRAGFTKIDQIRLQALQKMRDFDVIISPVVATPAKNHGTTQSQLYDMCYTMVYNLLGWPATVVRCGESKTGLPIGVQIAAKPWCDGEALAMAKHLESVFSGWQIPNVSELTT